MSKFNIPNSPADPRYLANPFSPLGGGGVARGNMGTMQQQYGPNGAIPPASALPITPQPDYTPPVPGQGTSPTAQAAPTYYQRTSWYGGQSRRPSMADALRNRRM